MLSWKRWVAQYTRKIGLTDRVPAFKRLESNTKIMVMAGVLLLVIAWVYTLPVIKLSGTKVGTGVVYTTNASYASFASRALEMGLDFMIIDTDDPEVESRCVMDKKTYNFDCFILKDGRLDGREIKICDSLETGCEAIRIYKPSGLLRAAISCTKMPPQNCVLRPFPMWHRLVIPFIFGFYFVMVVFSMMRGEQTKTEKVLELHRSIRK